METVLLFSRYFSRFVRRYYKNALAIFLCGLSLLFSYCTDNILPGEFIDSSPVKVEPDNSHILSLSVEDLADCVHYPCGAL